MPDPLLQFLHVVIIDIELMCLGILPPVPTMIVADMLLTVMSYDAVSVIIIIIDSINN